jgi:hypothetical protein
MKAVIAFGLCLIISGSAFSQTIYDINFNNQSANQVVQSGTAPNHVSSVVFGTPLVVPSFGGLTDQPLRMDMVGNGPSYYYDQFQLNMSRLANLSLDVAFDFTSSGLVGSPATPALVVWFDTPSVRNVYFRADGQISLYAPGSETVVGNFANNETFRFLIHIDLAAHQWATYKNGVLLGQTTFTPDDYISSIRFGYGLVNPSLVPDGSAVGIDKLVVSVPEPTAATLGGVACVAWIGFRSVRRMVSPKI